MTRTDIITIIALLSVFLNFYLVYFIWDKNKDIRPLLTSFPKLQEKINQAQNREEEILATHHVINKSLRLSEDIVTMANGKTDYDIILKSEEGDQISLSEFRRKHARRVCVPIQKFDSRNSSHSLHKS